MKNGCTALLFLTITCFQYLCAQNVYVKPTPDTPCPYDTCHTLIDYTDEVGDQYFTSNTSRMVLLFLPGDHVLDGGVVTVSNLTTVYFRGNSSFLPDITSRIVCTRPTSFHFTNIDRVELEFLTFVSCGITPLHPGSAYPSYYFCSYNFYGKACHNIRRIRTGAICVSSVIDFKLTSCSVMNSYLALFACGSQVTLQENKFINNTAECGAGISAYKSTLQFVGENTFVSNMAIISGGGIYAENCSLGMSGRIDFFNNSASGGGGMYVQFTDLIIDGNGSFVHNWAKSGGGMFVHSSEVSLYGNTTFIQNSALVEGGGVTAYNAGIITIYTNSRFIQNVAQNGGGIFVTLGILQVSGNISLIDNTGLNGGGILIWDGTANFNGHSSFILNSAGHRGGGMSALTAVVNFEGNHSFTGNIATKFGGGILVFDSTVVLEEIGSLTQTHNVAQYGGGTFVMKGDQNSTLLLDGSSIFSENLGAFGGALAAQSGHIKLNGNSTFVRNLAEHGGAVFLENSPQCILNGISTFVDNEANAYGGAIHSYRSLLFFGGSQLFTNNFAAYGGGVALTGRDKTKLHLLPNTVARFVGNNAKLRGGALVVEDSPFTSCISDNTTNYFGETCFIQTNPGYCSEPHNISTCKFAVLLSFDNNLAEEAGNILYGGNIGMCRVEIDFPLTVRYSLSGAHMFHVYGEFLGESDATSKVSSDPFRVCACNDSQLALEESCSQSLPDFQAVIRSIQIPFVFDKPTYIDIPPPWPTSNSDNPSDPFQVCGKCVYSDLAYDVYPGETLQVHVVTVGQLGGTVPGVVHTKFDTAGGILKLGDLQTTQVVNKKCTPIQYAVFSKNLEIATEVLLTIFAEGPCLGLGHPLSVLVKLHPCPIAFTLSVEGGCICERRLQSYTNSCDINSGSIQGDGEFWVGLTINTSNYSSRLILHPHCPL